MTQKKENNNIHLTLPTDFHPTTNSDLSFVNGMPFGGLGTGSFSRSPAGDFNVWHQKLAVRKLFTFPFNQFFISIDGELYSMGGDQAIRSYTKENIQFFTAEEMSYHALYPKSWIVYRPKKHNVEIVCEQFSPVFKDNYKESTYPLAHFNFSIRNLSDSKINVSIVYFMTNMLGCFSTNDANDSIYPNEGHYNKTIDYKNRREIVFKNKYKAGEQESYGENGISISKNQSFEVSSINQFLVKKQETETGLFIDSFDEAEDLLAHFNNKGALNDSNEVWISKCHRQIAGGLCAKGNLSAQAEEKIAFQYTWDNPIVEFGLGRKWYKKYTAFYGKTGTAASLLLKDAHANHEAWAQRIDEEHSAILELPMSDTAKTLMINEAYYLIHGGTFYENGMVNKSEDKLNPEEQFGILEGFDFGYHFYNTIGLVYHAVFSLAHHYPKLLKKIVDDFTYSLDIEDDEMAYIVSSFKTVKRKPKYVIPHDQDTFSGDPFVKFNGYETNSNPAIWKDQYPAFVLIFYTYYKLCGQDKEHLKARWDLLLKGFDAYFDEFCNYKNILPSHDAPRDNNWDALDFKGISSYLSNLYLASITALRNMSRDLGYPESEKRFSSILEKGKSIVEEELIEDGNVLMDSEGENKHSCFMDQAAGDWILSLLNEETIFSSKQIDDILERLYVNNFENQPQGPIMLSQSKGIQADECLIGMGYMFASFLMKRNKKEKAEAVLAKMASVLQAKGLSFMTPAAINSEGIYRAPYNMRPLSIWALVQALKPSA